MRTFERRFMTSDIEVRKDSRGQAFIEGYAAVFDSPSEDLGGFIEVVKHGAFTRTIREADIRALFNHNPDLVLGRNMASTLSLAADTRGLHYRIEPPDVSYVRDLEVLMGRGDVNQSSFGGFFVDDNWKLVDGEHLLREVREVILVDVSVVTYPAYEATSSEYVRGAFESLSKRSGIQVTDLSDLDAVRKAILAPSGSTLEERKAVMAERDRQIAQDIAEYERSVKRR